MDARTRAHLKPAFSPLKSKSLLFAYTKGISLIFLHVLSKTGHYTHNNVLIHDNSDYETYEMLTRWLGHGPSYYYICRKDVPRK